MSDHEDVGHHFVNQLRRSIFINDFQQLSQEGIASPIRVTDQPNIDVDIFFQEPTLCAHKVRFRNQVPSVLQMLQARGKTMPSRGVPYQVGVNI